jgi:hypothetical protein
MIIGSLFVSKWFEVLTSRAAENCPIQLGNRHTLASFMSLPFKFQMLEDFLEPSHKVYYYSPLKTSPHTYFTSVFVPFRASKQSLIIPEPGFP